MWTSQVYIRCTRGRQGARRGPFLACQGSGIVVTMPDAPREDVRMNRRWAMRFLFALGAGLLLAWLPYVLTQGVDASSLDLSGRLGLSGGVRASTFAIL